MAYKAGRCPNSNLYFKSVVDPDGDLPGGFVTGYGRCKSWRCSHCAPINAWLLRKQMEYGLCSLVDQLPKKGFRPEYFVKFLTLTLPGAFYRSTVSKPDAEKELKKSFEKMVMALRKSRGWFDYAWVLEPQRDGYPHLHVLLVGETVASKDMLEDIETLWRVKYSMGFVRLNVVKGGVFGVARYVTKYMSKGMAENTAEKRRVFGLSKAFRSAKMLPKRSFRCVEWGKIERDPYGHERFAPMWQASDESCFLDFDDPVVSDAVLSELVDFFEAKRFELWGFKQKTLM